MIPNGPSGRDENDAESCNTLAHSTRFPSTKYKNPALCFLEASLAETRESVRAPQVFSRNFTDLEWRTIMGAGPDNQTKEDCFRCHWSLKVLARRHVLACVIWALSYLGTAHGIFVGAGSPFPVVSLERPARSQTFTCVYRYPTACAIRDEFVSCGFAQITRSIRWG